MDVIRILCEPITYLDAFRGNWGVDLQAGSEFGYWLLFVVLLAGLFAVFLQVRPHYLQVFRGCVAKTVL